MIRYTRVHGYHVALEYKPVEQSLFRLTVAWLASLAGAFLFLAAWIWVELS